VTFAHDATPEQELAALYAVLTAARALNAAAMSVESVEDSVEEIIAVCDAARSLDCPRCRGGGVVQASQYGADCCDDCGGSGSFCLPDASPLHDLVAYAVESQEVRA